MKGIKDEALFVRFSAYKDCDLLRKTPFGGKMLWLSKT
jgi:hypothetical protein